MKISRRHFFGAVGVMAGLVGCDSGPGAFRRNFRNLLGKPTAAPLQAPFLPPQSSLIDPVSHVLARLTFGAQPGDHALVESLGIPAFIESQLAPQTISDPHCQRIIRHECDSLSDPQCVLFPRKRGGADSPSTLFPFLQAGAGRVGDLYEYREKTLLTELTRSTLLRAALSRRQLQEVMVEFWTDHFNIDPSKGECKWLKAADDRDVIRTHALGKFHQLLRASALSPAMLWYLDGRQNLRSRPSQNPNENYARELLELHTLGVHGGYSQRDVMEVARCLTGWTCRDKKRFLKGRVEFHPNNHDNGPKEVLGILIPSGLGPADLDRVLSILSSHPSCARHLAWKLCRKFIADSPPEAAIESTAQAFSRSQGDIPATLRALFTTPEFWAPENRGTKFKRPFHFVVSALRATNAETDASPALLDHLLRMGHAPFRYPTPDGYPEEAHHWQSALLWRWNFATALANNQIHGTRIDTPELLRKTSPENLAAFLLGRQPAPHERAAFEAAPGLDTILASPAFQRC